MADLTRRDVLGAAGLVGGFMILGARPTLGQQSQPTAAAGGTEGPYQLPSLPYGYADLEPFIRAETVKLHHDVHHAGYVKGANAAVAELEQIRRTGGDAVARVRAATDALTFNLSGHVLHDIYWKGMKKDGSGDPPADSDAHRMITRDFGTLDAFRANFAAAAVQVQGSGWAVLAYEPVAQRLLVLQAEKHQNLGVWGVVPLLVCDVWEHAYYLDYQNKRSDYVAAFLKLINWSSVQDRLHLAMKLT
jgi:superoxide dismutase, Fe-Mn family